MSTTILVIEDNEQSAYLMRYLLESEGFSVVVAREGRHGGELAARLVPALIVLDIQLPEMDGYAVAAALRQNAALSHVPILAVTSHAMPGDRERVLASGCDGYIEKPIDPEPFVEQVRRQLAARSQMGLT